MTSEKLVYHEIVRLDDPLLLPWLELYETAFPASERVLISSILHIISSHVPGEDRKAHFVAVSQSENGLVGMVMYNLKKEINAAFLWYMAVDRRLRSRSIGTQIYQELLGWLRLHGSNILIFEVEIPEGENCENASRRIRFYHKQGALLLEGIKYMQHVGWHQEPIPMYVMVHPLRPLDPEEAFSQAKLIFQNSIEQTGKLRLQGSKNSDE